MKCGRPIYVVSVPCYSVLRKSPRITNYVLVRSDKQNHKNKDVYYVDMPEVWVHDRCSL